MKIVDLDLSPPYITAKIKGIGGKIRSKPDHFIVEEIPAYEPLGRGDHIYINITKSLKTTRETQIELSKLFGINRENVGHAGLKDKYATTTQTFSVLLKNEDVKGIAKAVEDNLGFKVNWIKKHPRKLRSGHLKGNKFQITITDLEDNLRALKQANKIRQVVEKSGIPNYFGPQRFGNNAGNVHVGYDIITGTYHEPNRWLRRYLISSYLSLLCNRYLSERIRNGLFETLLKGDLAKKHDTGGVFIVEDPVKENVRFESKQISFTAPIFGYKMREATSEAKVLEEKIFSNSGVTLENLRKVGAEGSRRLGRLTPELKIIPSSDGINVLFSLPAGAYATTVLREIMKQDTNGNEIEAINHEDINNEF